MAPSKLSRFSGTAENDEMNEVLYTEAEQQEEKAPQVQKDERRTNAISINSGVGATSKVALYEPRVYSDTKEAVQNLLNNKAAIINLARMDDEQARKIVDLITGTAYALNGEVQHVGDKIFLVTPPKFETDGKIAELVERKGRMDQRYL